MTSAVTSGLFALGGVALGAGIDWLRSSGASRRQEAAHRDDAFMAITNAAGRLVIECQLWRNLGTRQSQLRQFAYGLMDAEAERSVAMAPNLSVMLSQFMAGAVAHGLRHNSPVERADRIRRELMPLLSEIFVLAVRLSMDADERLKAAADRLGQAAGDLVAHLEERDKRYEGHEDELRAAIGQLRRARDAAAVPRWRWRRKRKLRKMIT